MAKVRFQVLFGRPLPARAETAGRPNYFRGGAAAVPFGDIRSEAFDVAAPPSFADLLEIFPRGGWMGDKPADDDLFTPGSIPVPKEYAHTVVDPITFQLSLEVGGAAVYTETFVLAGWFEFCNVVAPRRSAVANRHCDVEYLERIRDPRAPGRWSMDIFYKWSLLIVGDKDDILAPGRRAPQGLAVSYSKPTIRVARDRPYGNPSAPMTETVTSITPAISEHHYASFLKACGAALTALSGLAAAPTASAMVSPVEAAPTDSVAAPAAPTESVATPAEHTESVAAPADSAVVSPVEAAPTESVAAPAAPTESVATPAEHTVSVAAPADSAVVAPVEAAPTESAAPTEAAASAAPTEAAP